MSLYSQTMWPCVKICWLHSLKQSKLLPKKGPPFRNIRADLNIDLLYIYVLLWFKTHVSTSFFLKECKSILIWQCYHCLHLTYIHIFLIKCNPDPDLSYCFKCNLEKKSSTWFTYKPNFFTFFYSNVNQTYVYLFSLEWKPN